MKVRIRLPLKKLAAWWARWSAKPGNWRCRRFHRSDTMWPHHGMYECRRCGRKFPAQWEDAPHVAAAGTPIVRQAAPAAPAHAREKFQC